MYDRRAGNGEQRHADEGGDDRADQEEVVATFSHEVTANRLAAVSSSIGEPRPAAGRRLVGVLGVLGLLGLGRHPGDRAPGDAHLEPGAISTRDLVLVEPRDRAVDPAGGDDLVADARGR